MTMNNERGYREIKLAICNSVLTNFVTKLSYLYVHLLIIGLISISIAIDSCWPAQVIFLSSPVQLYFLPHFQFILQLSFCLRIILPLVKGVRGYLVIQ